jgi:hypothetical protein
MNSIVSSSVFINGLAFEGGDEGIYADFTPDNDKWSLYVGKSGQGTYVKNEAYGRGSGTLNAFKNTAGKRLLQNLYDNGTDCNISYVNQFGDGSIETLNLIDCKIVKAEKISIASTGEKESAVVNYKFFARDSKII